LNFGFSLSSFENLILFNTLINLKEYAMSAKTNLVGKTISGVVAVQEDETNPVEIWMLQFSDGTHVEFVSPSAKRRLRVATRSRRRPNRRQVPEAQLALNVA
jgi:hypothetical protein